MQFTWALQKQTRNHSARPENVCNYVGYVADGLRLIRRLLIPGTHCSKSASGSWGKAVLQAPEHGKLNLQLSARFPGVYLSGVHTSFLVGFRTVPSAARPRHSG